MKSPLGNTPKPNSKHYLLAQKMVWELGLDSAETGRTQAGLFLTQAVTMHIACLIADTAPGFAQNVVKDFIKDVRKNKSLFQAFGKRYNKVMGSDVFRPKSLGTK